MRIMMSCSCPLLHPLSLSLSPVQQVDEWLCPPRKKKVDSLSIWKFMYTLSMVKSHQERRSFATWTYVCDIVATSYSCYRPIRRASTEYQLHLREKQWNTENNVSCIGKREQKNSLDSLTMSLTSISDGFFSLSQCLRDFGAIVRPPSVPFSLVFLSLLANVSRTVDTMEGASIKELSPFWIPLTLSIPIVTIAIFRPKIRVGKQCNLPLFLFLSLSLSPLFPIRNPWQEREERKVTF